MNQKTLGLIEVIGLVPALEAADACLKAANVHFVGYETVTPGMVTVKIEGDIGAVQAAISAGRISADKIGTVISSLVIPRPALALNQFHQVSETTEKKAAEAVNMEELQVKEHEMIPEVEQSAISDVIEEVEVVEEDSFAEEKGATESSEQRTGEVSCNLCNDPACAREKGQPRTQCLHHKEHKVVLG
jgi:ethanolamine utilization protein EutM